MDMQDVLCNVTERIVISYKKTD